MKNPIKSILVRGLDSAISYRRRRKQYSRLEERERKAARMSGVQLRHAPGEDAWCDFWRPLTRYDNRCAFRLYSAYCGSSLNLICGPACEMINLALNPWRYRGYYADKNMFNRILPASFMPRTIMRRMRGVLTDEAYAPVGPLSDDTLSRLTGSARKVVMKPTLDTCSGHGVMLFEKEHGSNAFINRKSGKKLDTVLIAQFNHDFIIQEAVEQHPFMARFNPTSVNTIRVATYRSVADNKVHVLSSVLRMGATGSVVDNATGGGMIAGVDETGRVGNYCFDVNGKRSDSHNSINFKEQSLVVPHFEEIKSLAKKVAGMLDYCRLVQHDIALDSEGHPLLIEYNVTAFSCWLAQFAGQPAFGDFAKEIRDYTLGLRQTTPQA